MGRGGDGGDANESRPRGGGGGGGYAEGIIRVSWDVQVNIDAVNMFGGVASIQTISGGGASG